MERQLRENRAYAVERGLPISEAHTYVDPHFSAWKDSGGKRPAWQDMMGAASRGEVAGVIVWKLDRFTRSPRDLEDLIDLADLHGLVIDGPHTDRIDLSTANGHQQARGAANQAAAESDNTSERCQAGLEEVMKMGEPQGPGRAFGFLGNVGDARAVVREDEAAIVREVARRALEGEPLAVLATELNERGVPTARGGVWTGANLGRLLGQGRYGGLVEAKGKLFGRMPGEPILDRDTFDAVRALLASRRRGKRPTERFELTGVIVCDRCDLTMNGAEAQSSPDKKYRQYRCPRSRGGCGQAIAADRVEGIVGDHMIKLLSNPGNLRDLRARDTSAAAEHAKAQQAVQGVEDQLVALELKLANGEIIQRAYDVSRPVLDKRLAAARAALAEHDAPSVRPEVAANLRWQEANSTERRALIQRFRVRIRITAPTARRWQPERVRIA